AGDVCEHAIEAAGKRHGAGIGGDDMNVIGSHQTPHQRGPMRMEFQGDNQSPRALLSEDASLSPGCGAAVQDPLSPPEEQGHKLRCFVLKHEALFAEGWGMGEVPASYHVGTRDQISRLERDTFSLQILSLRS